MKSLFYHTAKDSLTKLTKEEISVDADQLKAKTADETDHTQKPQTGDADGNNFLVISRKIDSFEIIVSVYLFIEIVVCLNKNNFLFFFGIDFYFFTNWFDFALALPIPKLLINRTKKNI